MPPSLPPRKFAPTPVETTNRSSKDKPAQENADPAKPVRHFTPEPIETITKSDKGVRKTERETGECVKPARRFVSEAVETSQRSSKDKNNEREPEHSTRRFAPQLVEVLQPSSKDKKKDQSGSTHVKFSPQLVEVTRGGNRARKAVASSEPNTESESDGRRKFAPVLIDTAKRSRRNGEPNPATTYMDRTEEGHQLHAREHRHHITGKQSPTRPSEDDLDSHMPDAGEISPTRLDFSHELRREVSPLDGSHRPSSLTNIRQHSFKCPELETIESSESEGDSNGSSLGCSPNQASPITASDSSFNDFKQAASARESVDENFSHYLIQLETRRAEQRLREQALAAFPNSDYHEHVQHYVDEDKDTDSDLSIDDRPTTWEGHDDEPVVEKWRRESTAKVPWEQVELQRHAEQLDEERKFAATTAKKKESTQKSPWWQSGFEAAIARSDNELVSMRDRARPPMLGGDLRFPRCPSPEPARFDVTQGSMTLRNQMCYLTETATAERNKDDGDTGLWHGRQATAHSASLKSPSPSANSAGKGLWGGFCVESEQDEIGNPAPPSRPTGLMTPQAETARTVNPFEQSFAYPTGAAGLKTTPTPPSSLNNSDLGRIDSVLVSERELDNLMAAQYPDSFITQVYNYLSLGYPSLAQRFDEELAKISRMPTSELRKDDQVAQASPRGYIRLGPDFEGGGGEVSEVGCVRWQALKLYVREWARQEKDMVNDAAPGGNWGTGARRGSWAI